ncbi:MAG: hypothetical protein KF812_02425 [Fimbriimonadaceae bacterium]|nr:hypothetical protein [Fimbriimonadaceae bacterium]
MAGERSEERLVYLCDLPEAKRLLRAGIRRLRAESEPVPNPKFYYLPLPTAVVVTSTLFIWVVGYSAWTQSKDNDVCLGFLIVSIVYIIASIASGQYISSPSITQFIRNEYRVQQLNRVARLTRDLEEEEQRLKSMEFRLAQARLRIEHGPQSSRSDLEPELTRRAHYFKHQLEAVRQDREQLEELSVWTQAFVEFTFAPTLGKSNDEVLSEARRITAEVSSSLDSLSNRRIDLTDSSTSASDLLKSLETRLATRLREEREVEVTLADNSR